MSLGQEIGAQAARSRALAVLRVRGRATAVALLPAAVAVVLLVGGATGHIGSGWSAVSRPLAAVGAIVLLAAAGIGLVVARARPAVSPTVPIAESSAPDLYRLVRDLADRLDVPAPSAIALTPDCDSWLEDRTHPAHGRRAGRAAKARRGAKKDGPGRVTVDRAGRSATAGPGAPQADDAPVLVIGSPFLWWMRVAELRAVLAPVVAGTGPSAHPDIAAARRFVRGLDAAVAVAAAPGRGAVTGMLLRGVGWVARLLLRSCRGPAAQMERGVAAAAAERAQAVDYGVRIVAQEQVGLAYAGWDRLLTKVALPAWRMGRWPSRLDAGVVAALTELSRRDRLAEGFATRLGERPACDLLEEPGSVDEAASLLAARLFHGGPAEPGPDWAPVGWQEYPEEVVDRKWRADAARLHRVLDALGVRHHGDPRGTGQEAAGPTLSRVLTHLARPQAPEEGAASASVDGPADRRTDAADVTGVNPAPTRGPAPASAPDTDPAPDLTPGTAAAPDTDLDLSPDPDLDPEDTDLAPDTDPDACGTEQGTALAAGLSAELAREEREAPVSQAASPAVPVPASGQPGQAAQGVDDAFWPDGMLPLFPLQPPRTGRELLADHVTAMVCCSAVDTAGAAPGLDWLDGPSLLVGGERAADLAPRVLSLVEDGDPEPLRGWLTRVGIRPEKPVRLV